MTNCNVYQLLRQNLIPDWQPVVDWSRQLAVVTLPVLPVVVVEVVVAAAAVTITAGPHSVVAVVRVVQVLAAAVVAGRLLPVPEPEPGLEPGAGPVSAVAAEPVIKHSTVKPVLSGHSKLDKTKILMTNGSLMKVESIAECSKGSILQSF